MFVLILQLEKEKFKTVGKSLSASQNVSPRSGVYRGSPISCLGSFLIPRCLLIFMLASHLYNSPETKNYVL